MGRGGLGEARLVSPDGSSERLSDLKSFDVLQGWHKRPLTVQVRPLPDDAAGQRMANDLDALLPQMAGAGRLGEPA